MSKLYILKVIWLLQIKMGRTSRIFYWYCIEVFLLRFATKTETSANGGKHFATPCCTCITYLPNPPVWAKNEKLSFWSLVFVTIWLFYITFLIKVWDRRKKWAEKYKFVLSLALWMALILREYSCGYSLSSLAFFCWS